MAIKALQKSVKKESILPKEHKVEKFISKGGSLAKSLDIESGDHRLTLRIPKQLMEKVDIARKTRIGKISRNLWILELIEKATRSKD